MECGSCCEALFLVWKVVWAAEDTWDESSHFEALPLHLLKSGLFWESPDFQRSKKITLFFWAVGLGVKGVPVTFGEVAA